MSKREDWESLKEFVAGKFGKLDCVVCMMDFFCVTEESCGFVKPSDETFFRSIMRERLIGTRYV